MDTNTRAFNDLEWPDSIKRTKTTQPEKQAEELPTEEKH